MATSKDEVAKARQYRVVGALAVPYTPEGQPVYVYRNAVLPVGVTQESVDHLLSVGLIAPVED